MNIFCLVNWQSVELYSGARIIGGQNTQKIVRIMHTSKSMGKHTIVRISEGLIVQARSTPEFLCNGPFPWGS